MASNTYKNLTPAQLAAVVCAITTEDMRADLYSQLPLSPNVRKTLNKIKDLKRDLDKTVLVFFVSSAVFFFFAYVVKLPILNVLVMVLAILTANGASSMMWTEYCLSLRETGMVSSATGYLDFLSYAAAAVANVIFAVASTSIGWGNLILVWCALMVLGTVISLPLKNLKKKKV